jgi:ABC-type glycerol-3-phosphate transport system substrate-binding protein
MLSQGGNDYNVMLQVSTKNKDRRGKIRKSWRLVLCLVMLVVGVVGCGKDDAQSTASIGIDGYVYVPTYREISTPQDSYIGSFVLSQEGDTLYYLQTNYGGMGLSNQMYSLSLTEESEPTPIPVEIPDNSSVYQLMMDQEGNFIFLMQAYDMETNVTQYILEKYDSNGTLLSTVDVSEQLNEDPDNSYIQYVALDGEGNYYVSNGQTIWLYQASGTYHGKFELSNYSNGMSTGKDGKVYVIYYSDNNMELAAIDFAGKKVGQTYANVPNQNGSNMAPSMNGGFLINDGSGLVEYDLATQTYQRILNWVDSDVSGNSMLLYSALSDGRILVVNYIWEEDSSRTEIAFLSKTSVTELPEKEIIQIGSLYDSYTMRETAIKFNKSSEKYRVTLKTYIDSNAAWTETSYKDAVAVMNNEISANKAPDILMMTSGTVDLAAYAAKDAIVDLFDFIDKDEELKRDDLVESVVKAFTYNDKLIGLPGTFSIQTIAGKSSVVGDQPGITIEQLGALMDQYPETPLFPYATRDNMMNVLLAFSLDSFIDWDKAKCQFNDEAFKQVLELCKRFPKEVDYDTDYDGMGGGIAGGTVLLEDAYIYDITSYQVYRARVSEPITFLGYPTPDGSAGGAIQASDGIYTITGKSKHKEGAWEFLKYLMHESNENMGSLPILKSDLEELFTEAMTAEYQLDENGQPVLDENGEKIELSKGGFGFGNGDMIDIYAATQEDVDGFKALLDSAGVNYGGSLDIMSIITEESEGYFEGQKTVDEVADIIQSRVQIYVSENS